MMPTKAAAPIISYRSSLLIGSTRGILAPTVVLRHTRNVLLIELGSGETGTLFVVLVFVTGALDANAAVLLYESKESAKEEAR